MYDIGIIGCGWLGLPLAKKLKSLGLSVFGTVTSNDRKDYLTKEGIDGHIAKFSSEETREKLLLPKSKVLLIAIPPKGKGYNYPDYPKIIQSIVSAAREALTSKIVLLSSTSVYPANGNTVDEATQTSPSKRSGNSLIEAERLIKNSGMEYLILRLCGLYGPNREPGKFLAGKTDVPGANNPVNLIHQEDVVEIISQLVQKEVFGEVYNVCCQDHPSRKRFYADEAKKLGLLVPEFNFSKQLPFKIVSSSKIINFLRYQFKHRI